MILASGGASGAGELDIYDGRARGSIGTLPPGATQRVVDIGAAGQVNRHIFGDSSSGAIGSVQVYEVTGEGARDVIVGVPSVGSSARRYRRQPGHAVAAPTTSCSSGPETGPERGRP